MSCTSKASIFKNSLIKKNGKHRLKFWFWINNVLETKYSKVATLMSFDFKQLIRFLFFINATTYSKISLLTWATAKAAFFANSSPCPAASTDFFPADSRQQSPCSRIQAIAASQRFQTSSPNRTSFSLMPGMYSFTCKENRNSFKTGKFYK